MSSQVLTSITINNNVGNNNSSAFTRLGTLNGHADLTMYIYGGANPANSSIDVVFADTAADALTEYTAGRVFKLLMPGSGDMTHQFHANPNRTWVRGTATATNGTGGTYDAAAVWTMAAY